MMSCYSVALVSTIMLLSLCCTWTMTSGRPLLGFEHPMMPPPPPGALFLVAKDGMVTTSYYSSKMMPLPLPSPCDDLSLNGVETAGRTKGKEGADVVPFTTSSRENPLNVKMHTLFKKKLIGMKYAGTSSMVRRDTITKKEVVESTKMQVNEPAAAGEDIDVKDYAQPHRRPPIHNIKN